jgi:hypothetical protein
MSVPTFNNWKRVLCSHEEKQILAASDWLGDNFPGCALPDQKALTKWVEIRYKGNWTPAQCRDIGPWTIDDSAYVLGNARPRAEIFKGEHVRVHDGGPLHELTSNGAGIDLFPATAKALGINLNENVQVEWRFLEAGGGAV